MERRTGDFNIVREAGTMLGSNLFHLFLEFLTLAVLSRSIPIESVGAYFVVLSVVGLYQVPFNALIDALRKFGSEEGGLVNELYGTVIGLSGIGTLLFYGLLSVSNGFLLRLVGVSPKFALSATILFFGWTLFGATTELLAVDGYLGRESLLHTARFVLIFAVFWTLAGLLTAELAVYFRAVVSVLISIGIVIGRGDTIPRVPSRETIENVAEYSIWHIPSKLLRRARRRVPELVISSVFGTQPVALYRAAEQISQIAGYTVFSLSRPFFVRSSWLESRDEMEFDVLETVMRYTPVIPTFLFAFVIPFGEAMMTSLYTPAYAAGWAMLIVLVVNRIVVAYRAPLRESLLGVGATRKVFRARLAAGVVGGVLYALGGLFGTPLTIVVALLIGNIVLSKAYQLASEDVFGDSIGFSNWMGHVVLWGSIGSVVSHGLHLLGVFTGGWVWAALPLGLGLTIGIAAALRPWVRAALESGWRSLCTGG